MNSDENLEFLEYEKVINNILNDRINAINEVYDRVDVLEFLSYLSYKAKITFDNAEGYTYISPIHFEYLVGLFLSKEYNKELKGKGNIGDSENVLNMLNDIIPAWKLSNSFRKSKNKTSENELKKGLFEASIISSYGSIRGYSWYSPYMDNQYISLLKSFDLYLQVKVGFTIQQAFEYIKVIVEIYKIKVNDIKGRIIENIFKNSNEKCGTKETIIKEATFNVNYKEIMFFSIEEVLDLNNDIDLVSFKRFLDRFSTVIGQDGNKEFRYLSDDNDYRWRPILKYNEKYFVQNTTRIYWILKDELENDLREDSIIWDKYQKHKSNYLEKESLELFKKILPEAQIYQSLYYKIDGQRYELDGLVVYDSNLLIIEAKSGLYNRAARRGRIGSLKKIIYNNIEYAFKQANRVKNYILNCDNIIFENAKGEEIVNIKKDLYQNIFNINVTLEYFAELSVELYKLKELNLYNSNEFPWTITLSDLAVISDFIKFPSQFIHYILFRSKFNNTMSKENNLKLTYELDLLGVYLTEDYECKENYIIEDIDQDVIITNMLLNKKDDSTCAILDYSRIFNKYYNLLLEGNYVDKLEKEINTHIYKIVCQIEKYNIYGYSNFALKFLDLSIKEQEKIVEYIDKVCSMVKKDGKDHNITIPFMKNRFEDKAGYGITIEAALSKDRDIVLENFKKFCIMKREQNKLKEWIGLCCFVDDNRSLVNNFIFVRDDGYYNEKLNTIINNSPKQKLNVGRNSLCPCGSRKKYKKCHGK